MTVYRATLAACLAALPFCVGAAEYPAKQIRMLIPFQPGGATDILARVS